MHWNYRIGREGNKFGLMEVYYKNKKKIIGYTDFFHVGKTKQDILNSLKELITENNKDLEEDKCILLNNHSFPFSRQDLNLMFLPNIKKKTLNLDNIKKRISRYPFK